jgi:hypothetical protein
VTGPEHYKIAESLLQPTTHYRTAADGNATTNRPTPEAVAEATAHAILALAAATGYGLGLHGKPDGYNVVSEWRGAVMP